MNRVLPIGNVLFRFSRIHYKRCDDYSSYDSSLILIKGCRISVRADTTYVVSFVEHVVAYVVLNFVSILVVSSCKESCNVLCNMFCNNTLVDCTYCYESVIKDISKSSCKYLKDILRSVKI